VPRSRAADGLGASEEVQSLVRLELKMVKEKIKNQRSSVFGDSERTPDQNAQ
jgi:hypothetical protein